LTDKSVVGPKPEVKLVGNMHGDETVGRQLLVRFLQDVILSNRTDILRNMDLFVLPSMNPDGFALGRRGNAQVNKKALEKKTVLSNMVSNFRV
jgi:carboxypeptidase D